MTHNCNITQLGNFQALPRESNLNNNNKKVLFIQLFSLASWSFLPTDTTGSGPSALNWSWPCITRSRVGCRRGRYWESAASLISLQFVSEHIFAISSNSLTLLFCSACSKSFVLPLNPLLLFVDLLLFKGFFQGSGSHFYVLLLITAGTPGIKDSIISIDGTCHFVACILWQGIYFSKMYSSRCNPTCSSFTLATCQALKQRTKQLIIGDFPPTQPVSFQIWRN